MTVQDTETFNMALGSWKQFGLQISINGPHLPILTYSFLVPWHGSVSKWQWSLTGYSPRGKAPREHPQEAVFQFYEVNVLSRQKWLQKLNPADTAHNTKVFVRGSFISWQTPLQWPMISTETKVTGSVSKAGNNSGQIIPVSLSIWADLSRLDQPSLS